VPRRRDSVPPRNNAGGRVCARETPSTSGRLAGREREGGGGETTLVSAEATIPAHGMRGGGRRENAACKRGARPREARGRHGGRPEAHTRYE